MAQWYSHEIAYCANVHPGTSASAIEKNLENITTGVRTRAGLERMHAGLWICESALKEYAAPEARKRLIAVLNTQHICVHTFNGFPQGDFHQPVVKAKVYEPTWADSRRLQYSLDLADLLAACLPENEVDGTISSLPLAYRIGWSDELNQQACRNLCRYALGAEKIQRKTGKRIRLCLEMEPGCVLERTEHVLHLFQHQLTQAAQDINCDERLISQYLGVCYDICHQAVMQENIEQSLLALGAAGITIGKVQVSAALKVAYNHEVEAADVDALSAFAEPKYLHQVTTLDASHQFHFYDDLTHVLDKIQNSREQPWWIHYHLPIQTASLMEGGRKLEGYATTRDDIKVFLDTIATFAYAPHLEIETYTWHVLPQSQRPDSDQALIHGLCLEREWLLSEMQQRQLIL